MSNKICPNCGEYVPDRGAAHAPAGAWRDPFGTLPPTEAQRQGAETGKNAAEVVDLIAKRRKFG